MRRWQNFYYHPQLPFKQNGFMKRLQFFGFLRYANSMHESLPIDSLVCFRQTGSMAILIKNTLVDS